MLNYQRVHTLTVNGKHTIRSVGRFPKMYGGPVARQAMAYKGQGTITLEEGSAKALLGCTKACGKKPQLINGRGEGM